MKEFLAYLRQHRLGLCCCALFCAVFFVSFLLYRLPPAAVSYPALLCLFLGVLVLLRDFFRALGKHRDLKRAAQRPAALLPDLPAASGLLEEDYQRLALALQKEALAAHVLGETRLAESMEYYTLWAHQIKTPITSMGLALEEEDGPKARRLRGELFQIEQYVEMVLAYLRLDGEGSDYVFREYDLDEILSQSLARFAAVFIDRGLSLRQTKTHFTVVTDEKHLAFVIEQLLSNALKYTREGEISVGPVGKGILAISDTGIGIAPEDLPRVFERGYTGNNGRIDKRASGIGLYLCRRVCRALGVGIQIQSVLGRGTTLFLDFNQDRAPVE